ncbi:MAG: hypothetical protein QG571_488, partial [Pseudomonadota bacterium]|nr:hypothetical protein [Pseudomonadota bacterium]
MGLMRLHVTPFQGSFLMAEALWTKPQNRARARALAQEANELYKRSGSEVDAE